MRKALPAIVWLVIAIAAGPALAGQAPAMKDSQLATRALTDADLEKYVAILAVLAQANRDRKGDVSPAAFQAVQAKKVEACAAQGWATLDYGVVDARMTAALMHLKMANVPVPDAKKADVDIARKYQARIAAAKK